MLICGGIATRDGRTTVSVSARTGCSSKTSLRCTTWPGVTAPCCSPTVNGPVSTVAACRRCGGGRRPSGAAREQAAAAGLDGLVPARRGCRAACWSGPPPRSKATARTGRALGSWCRSRRRRRARARRSRLHQVRLHESTVQRVVGPRRVSEALVARGWLTSLGRSSRRRDRRLARAVPTEHHPRIDGRPLGEPSSAATTCVRVRPTRGLAPRTWVGSSAIPAGWEVKFTRVLLSGVEGGSKTSTTWNLDGAGAEPLTEGLGLRVEPQAGRCAGTQEPAGSRS